MNDLRSHIGRLRREYGYDVAEEVAAQAWLHDVFRPEVAKAHEAVQVGRRPDPGLLRPARGALAAQRGGGHGRRGRARAGGARPPDAPSESAATIAFVDMATTELPALGLDRRRPSVGERPTSPRASAIGYRRAWPQSRWTRSTRSTRTASRRSSTSASTSPTASSSCSSDRPAVGSRPPCAWSPVWRRSAAASCASATGSSTMWNRRTGTSRWCSRTTRCTPT